MVDRLAQGASRGKVKAGRKRGRTKKGDTDRQTDGQTNTWTDGPAPDRPAGRKREIASKKKQSGKEEEEKGQRKREMKRRKDRARGPRGGRRQGVESVGKKREGERERPECGSMRRRTFARGRSRHPCALRSRRRPSAKMMLLMMM
eukprot:2396221-Pleurochrysis_carterae.AAC.1